MSLLPARAGSTATSSVAPSVAPVSSPFAASGSAATVVNGPDAATRAGGWCTSAAVNANTAPATTVSARSDRVSGVSVLPARGTKRDRFAHPTVTRARKPATLARSSCP
jgi:hypothetical protein